MIRHICPKKTFLDGIMAKMLEILGSIIDKPFHGFFVTVFYLK